MILSPSKHDPCLLLGGINDGTPPLNPQHKIHVGLYIDDFVFFSESDAEESRLKHLLNKKVTPDFMGDADFFLGTLFE